LTKLGVHSKTDAVVAAIRFGKATPPGRASSASSSPAALGVQNGRPAGPALRASGVRETR
jgi:hypothetical protein